jgi:FkbM family methyltransferase
MKSRFLWRSLKTRYRDQAAELSTIKHWVKPGDTVCDIGANKGSYLFWLSRWVAHGRVIAFEPQPQLASYLSQVCSALPLNNVRVEAKAVGAMSGTLTLYVPGAADSPGASLNTRVRAREACHQIPVPVVSLDDYFPAASKITLLKIDVEGAEKQVFEGAQRILTSQSPLLIFECENRHLQQGTVLDVFRHLEGLGYSGQFVCGNRLKPLSAFDPSLHQKESGSRFWDEKNYYNNFVFARPL